MNNNLYPNDYSSQSVEQTEAASQFMRQVFTIMTLGLSITGIVAYYFGQQLLADKFLFLFQSPMSWIITFAPLLLVMGISWGINKMSYAVANVAFALYALINGISFSYIFLVYTGASIAKVFLIAAGTFGAMAVIGAVTKINLSKLGSFLYMAVIGLIIAIVVNIFLASSVFDFIISLAGVAIFCGLTAYDTQKLLAIGANSDLANESSRKMALMGALHLYLDFVNLFLFLLRLLGGNRN